MDNLEKGVDAETRVGQIVEYAITAENCAVAHSVTMIARVGDLDHIVATPVSVWVIETKYRRVSKKSFSKVLSRIAANTDAVRQWVPARDAGARLPRSRLRDRDQSAGLFVSRRKDHRIHPGFTHARDEMRSTETTVAR